MSFAGKLKSRLIEIKNVASEKASNLKSELVADSDVAAQRLTICLACPSLNQKTSTCRECGCFVYAKTKITHSNCPLKKW